MSYSPSRCLVILTLNEVEGVRALYGSIPFDSVDEVLCIDGGSTDGTREFLQDHGLTVLSQTSKGRGEAFRLAAQYAKSEVLCFFSPDGNEDPSDIPKLFEGIAQGSDMVIARRFGRDARNEEDDTTFRFRAWANRAFTWIANLFWNRHGYVYDTINGFRAIRRQSFLQLGTDAKGFLIEYQSTIRAMKLGLCVSEIPTSEGQRIGGKSTAHSIPTGLLFLRGLGREIFCGTKFIS